MCEQYVHMLVPRDSFFAPDVEQVVRFLQGLSELEAAPLHPEHIVLKPSGRLRSFTDPLTGEIKSFPAQDRISFKDHRVMASALAGLQEYTVSLEGLGPPKVPPFDLFLKEALVRQTYALTVGCCLRSNPVSMSDPKATEVGPPVPGFGEACGSLGGDAILCHPITQKEVRVRGVGCARFWVEFEVGKWLLPNIGDSPNVLNPDILALANHSFEADFVQAFHLF